MLFGIDKETVFVAVKKLAVAGRRVGEA